MVNWTIGPRETDFSVGNFQEFCDGDAELVVAREKENRKKKKLPPIMTRTEAKVAL